eukprot:m.336390 g.336390  ORF g.336390 m.336390 type:complete len:297 (+) comp17838_c0_seq1:387-1277(+)
MKCVECNHSFGRFKHKKGKCDDCEAEVCSGCLKSTPKTVLREKKTKLCFACNVMALVPVMEDNRLEKISLSQLKMYLTEMNVQTNSSMTRDDIIELVKRARLTGEQPIRRRSSRRQPQQESASANADRTAPERRPSERIPLELFLAEQFIRMLLSGNEEETQSEEERQRDRELQKKRHEEILRKQENARILEHAKDPSEFSGLRVAQLKDILQQNFVDHSQCLEKHELLEKVVQLWEDRQKEVQQEDHRCKICMDNEINCVFLECGHLSTCVDCGQQLKECPMCRAPITRVVHVFK